MELWVLGLGKEALEAIAGSSYPCRSAFCSCLPAESAQAGPSWNCYHIPISMTLFFILELKEKNTTNLTDEL